MNQRAKSAIKSLVLDLRHKLEDDIAIQLKRYGFANKRWISVRIIRQCGSTNHGCARQAN